MLGVSPADPLWLDPLPDLLSAPTASDGLIHEPGHLNALVGLRDDPARHIQQPFSVDLGKSGNVLVVGTRGSGKSTALRAILIDLVEQHSPAHMHVYGIESGTGSLNPLAKIPHAAAIVPVGDRERLYRVFARLTNLMEERRESLAASGYGDFSSWRRGAAVPEPWVVLAIDDYPAFKEAADGSGLGLLNDQLMSLCQGGPSVGIHVVLSTSQPSDMRMNLVNLFGSRILLRQVDAADYSLLDLRLRPNELPPSNPGRALVAGGYEMQVFHTGDERVEDLVTAWAGETAGPEPILRLPTEISLESVETGPGHVIGVGGPEHHPFSLDFSRREPHLVIAGEGRSGRSTALITIFESLSGSFPDANFTFFAPRPSPVRHLAGIPGSVSIATAPDEMLRLLGELPGATGEKFLFIDDAESLPPEVGDQLERLLRDANQTGLRTFVSGRSTDLSRSFDGWVRYLLSLKSGLLLMPAPDGGFVFDVRLPATHITMTPGRGFMCDRGETTFVQIALPSGVNDGHLPAESAPEHGGNEQ
jgi:S-DNA-T family DNA segregation ATPase FtsK/SpoIIIE